METEKEGSREIIMAEIKGERVKDGCSPKKAILKLHL